MIVKINPHAMNKAINRFYDDEYFGGFDNSSNELDKTRSRYSPAVNVKESNDGFEIEMATPGFEKENFQINIEKNTLKISVPEKEASTNEKENENEMHYTHKEFAAYSFERSFELPKTADSDNIKARYNNGVLSVFIPRKEEVRVEKHIEIQ